MRIVNFMRKNRKLILVFMDIFFIIFSYLLAKFLSLDSYAKIIQSIDLYMMISILIAVLVYSIFLNIFGVYNKITKYENGRDYIVYGMICIISFVFTATIDKLANVMDFGIRSNLLASILIALFFVSYRVVIRIVITAIDVILSKGSNNNNTTNKSKKLLIIGAGLGARDIIKTIRASMRNEYEIIGIIDDDKNKMNCNISGIKVLGNRYDIPDICKKYGIDIIFFTIYMIKELDRKEILGICQQSKVKTRILPSTESSIRNRNTMDNLRDVEIEDLLGRQSINLDISNISNLIQDNVIMVTGGGGSIGSELCRQIINYNPKDLIILDIYENNLYDIELELKSKYPNINIIAIVASIRDYKKMDSVFNKYMPNIVFHAAAHKHVPLMESSPLEAIKNNVFGTYNVVNCADKYKAKKFILISSDKAVNPTNIMGSTKRLCEMIVQAKNKESKTEFVSVRFGNVLGSNGSVIPLFKKQIARGGPVTVTHKDITRFFMTIPEATQLVLQATTYAKGGEIFVLDMGEPVKIYDLAVSLIELSGLTPNVDIDIEITGLRPGEKLYEELFMKDEELLNTNHKKIYVAKQVDISIKNLEKNLKILNEKVVREINDVENIKATISAIVPTYMGQATKAAKPAKKIKIQEEVYYFEDDKKDKNEYEKQNSLQGLKV